MYIKSINQIAGYIKIITIFLIVISLKIYGQAQQFIITNIADSVSITDNQEKVIAKIFWNNDTSSVNADTIDVSILPTPIIPPSSGGVNYALSPSIKLTTRQSIRFPYSRVKMRIYADTSMFKLRDLQINQNITNAVVYIDTLKSAFNSVNLSKTDYDKNFVEFYITQMSDSNIYLFSAVSILMGTKNAEDLDTLGTSVLVPSGKSLILNPGAKLYSSNYAMIYVKGSLICNGTEQSPVNLNIDVNIIGQPDTIISNNVEQLNCMYVQGTHLSISYSEAKIINSSFIGIGVSQFSYSELNNVTIQTLVNCSQSYIKIDSSRILSNGWITTNRAIAVIENSVFENYTYDSNQYYSFLFFKNNLIYADAFLEPIQPLGCLLIYDGNKILFSGSDNGNKVGLSVWEDNYAIIRNNIVKGFRNAVEIGYNNKVLIYNNTFAENNGGVSLYGTIDSVSIYNNIFIHYSTRAIDLDVSTGYKADNRAWINRNLWYSPESPYACPYINCDTAGTGIVNGNTFSINKDPKFADSLNYQLLPGSPAIDMGDSVIPAFQYEFKVLDTTIALTSLIDIHDYFGNAPDIGAKEYNPTVSVKNKQKAVYFYRLQQNYPNPFNPSTNIEFQIANFGFVTLKIYDVLGREIETLVNEEKSPGRYEVKFSASNLASGLYFYRITSGNFSETKKMLLLK